MLQKPEEIRLERLLEFINGLNLRFPNKEIVNRTGYKSGVVSEYLKGKKPVSESFLKVFSEKFKADLDYLLGLKPKEGLTSVNNGPKGTITISQRHLII